MTRFSHMMFAPALAATALLAIAHSPASAQGFSVVKQTAGGFKEVKLGEKREVTSRRSGGPAIYEDAEEAKAAAQTAATTPQVAPPGSAPADGPQGQPGQPGPRQQARPQPPEDAPGDPGEPEPSAEN